MCIKELAWVLHLIFLDGSTLVSLGVQFKADLYGIPLEQMQRRLAGMKYTRGEAEILIIEGII